MSFYFGLTNLMSRDNIILNNFTIPSTKEMIFLIHYFNWYQTHDLLCGSCNESYIWLWKEKIWEKNIRLSEDNHILTEREYYIDNENDMKYYNFPLDEYNKFLCYNKCEKPFIINNICKHCKYDNKLNDYKNLETTNLTYFWN